MPGTPAQPDRRESRYWECISPEQAGLNSEFIEKLETGHKQGRYENLHSIVVVRHGKLVFERHYEGEDERHGKPLGRIDHGPEIRHDIRSIAKNVVGLLYGIALHEGKVPALETPLKDALPEYADLFRDPRRQQTNITHALSMTLGLDWNEHLPYTDRRNSETAMDRAPDRCRYVLEQKLVSTPGTSWCYNGGATTILAHLIARGTGQPLLDYARDRLFTPIGIDDIEWLTGSDGVPKAASGLRLRAADLARAGQLILNKGRWRGSQIVSQAWLDSSFVVQARVTDTIAYGLHWWLGQLQNGERWMAGIGNGGQRLAIFPSLDLVVVVFAGNYNKAEDWKLAVSILSEIIFPALRRPARG